MSENRWLGRGDAEDDEQHQHGGKQPVLEAVDEIPHDPAACLAFRVSTVRSYIGAGMTVPRTRG